MFGDETSIQTKKIYLRPLRGASGGPGRRSIFQILHFLSPIFSVRQKFSINIFWFLDYLGDSDSKMIFTFVEFFWREEISRLEVVIFEKLAFFVDGYPATPKNRGENQN